MTVLSGTKREITIRQWDESIADARKSLEDSKKCQELFGDHEEWVAEDEKKLEELERNKAKAIAFMDEHGIM